jgi:GntR family transcriptional regulator/MocR family aminotransferase
MVSTSLPEPVRGSRPAHTPEATGAAQYLFAAPPERPLALPSGAGLKLDEGTPDGRLFPPEALARAYRTAVLRASRDNRLQYRDPRGSADLREAVAAMLRSQRGLNVRSENICITRGSQHSIFLASQALLRPGDRVIVEELTYEPAVAAFAARGAEVVPVGLGPDGIDVDEVEAVCRRGLVRAVFLTPHHQFPTTVALRPERRLRLLELGRQFGFAILEDDYDHEFHFGGQPLLPMAAYAPEQVIYAGSLSKLALPALRIGYVAAPTAVIDALAHVVSLVDGMGNTLTEDAAAELMENGELRRHARKVRNVYAARRTRFAEILDATLGAAINYSLPDGGLAFWVRFRDPADLDRVESRAPGLGLCFATSRSFMARETAPRGLRVGFASLNATEALAAVRGLKAALT